MKNSNIGGIGINSPKPLNRLSPTFGTDDYAHIKIQIGRPSGGFAANIVDILRSGGF